VPTPTPIAFGSQASLISTLFALAAPSGLVVVNPTGVTGPAPTPDGSASNLASSTSPSGADAQSKKDDKAGSQEEVAAKKEEPVKKMYCN
jgi:hypothetical protein